MADQDPNKPEEKFSHQIIRTQFDKLYLAFIFVLCLAAIVLSSSLLGSEVAASILDYVKNSFLLGAIVGLVTGAIVAKKD